MRYGIRGATALLPMPPLPGSVVATAQVALPVAALGSTLALTPPRCRAAPRAIPVAAVAPGADDDPRAAARAGEHSMAVHGDRSPSGTGQPRGSSATLSTLTRRRCRCVARRKLGGLRHLVPGFRPVRTSMVAAPCSELACADPSVLSGDQPPRRHRQEPKPRAAPLESESDPAQTAGIRRIQAAVDSCAQRTSATAASTPRDICCWDWSRPARVTRRWRWRAPSTWHIRTHTGPGARALYRRSSATSTTRRDRRSSARRRRWCARA